MRDEEYVIDLCDEVLRLKSERQHQFNFLRGDTCRDGSVGRRLPVDAYYEKLKLVIEYHERQHTEAVPFMDKLHAVSGVSRSQQRKIYDERRCKILPENGIKLEVINVAELSCKPNKRLRQDKEHDLEVIRQRLAQYLE